MPIQVDRSAIRQMVEDHWRSMLSSIHQSQTPGDRPRVFSERVEAIIALMSQEEAEAFKKIVEEERGLLADDYDRDPIALKRRLNLPLNNPRSVTIIRAAPQAKPVVAIFLLGAVIFSVLVGIFLMFQ